MGRLGDTIILWAAGKMWRFDPYDEIGSKEDVDTPAGCTLPKSVVTTPYGLVFANEQGAWVFDGQKVSRISDRIHDDWTASTNDWRAAYAEDALHFAQGTAAGAPMYLLRRFGEALEWSTEAVTGRDNFRFLASSPDGTKLYGSTISGTYQIHGSATDLPMTIISKSYGDGAIRRGYWMYMDLHGAAAVTVTPSRATPGDYSISTTSRQVVRQSLPPSLLGEFWTIGTSGTGKLYGWQLELI